MIGNGGKMEVYYSASLWVRPRGKTGTKQVLNWSFSYLGRKRIIPCAYRFSKGIVFDIITLIEKEELEAFAKKCEGINEKELSQNQRRQLEQEHPYKEVSLAEIWINGKRVERGYSSTGSIQMPFLHDSDELKPIKSAYKRNLKHTSCFACQRFCVPYPKEAKARMRIRRQERGDVINTLKLVTHEEQIFYPIGQRFQLSDLDKTKEIKFKHPTKEREHTLYFQIEESIELPEQAMLGEKFYVTSATYEIVPALNEKEGLEFDSSISYKRKATHVYEPESASSIGIIGGASGPTSIFLAGKGEELPKGPHGVTLHTCFSKISTDKGESAQFILQGIHITNHPKEYYEYKRKGM